MCAGQRVAHRPFGPFVRSVATMSASWRNGTVASLGLVTGDRPRLGRAVREGAAHMRGCRGARRCDRSRARGPARRVLRGAPALARLHGQLPKFSALFDDDMAVQRELKTMDFGDADVFASQVERFGSWAGGERGAELGSRFVSVLPDQGRRARPRRLRGTPARRSWGSAGGCGARRGLRALGREGLSGSARRRGSDDRARVVHVAEQAVMAHFAGRTPRGRGGRRSGGT